MQETVKTVISLDRELLSKTQALAEDLRLSRSRVVALALEDFIRRNESPQMLEKLNTVYGKQGEETGHEGMRLLQRTLVDGEW
jgi:metal-responsive CopG/Arc/MetJ family transcriptional regulator